MRQYRSYEQVQRRRARIREAAGWTFVVIVVLVHDALVYLVGRAVFGV